MQSKPVFINSEPGYTTMDDYLVGIGKDHKDQYNWNYQIGATIEEEPDGKLNITGFFNNQAYHTIAISLSYLGNTLMQCFGNKDYQIETINHPLPKNSSEQVLETACITIANLGSRSRVFRNGLPLRHFPGLSDQRTKVRSQAQSTRERSQTA